MINMTSKYRTRDGRAVRILCIDLKGKDPVAAVVAEPNGIDSVFLYGADGSYWGDGAESDHDLFEVKQVVRFCRIYVDGMVGSDYATLEGAKGNHVPGLESVAGILKITLTDGVPSVEVVETFPQR